MNHAGMIWTASYLFPDFHRWTLLWEMMINLFTISCGRQKNFTGEHFWARGYFVSTVGLDENMVRAYIRNQEDEDERYDQMKLSMG